MRLFTTPKEVASFMQNAEGEVTIKGNDVYFNKEKIGEFHFPKVNKKGGS
ncbi:hypothetical protein [uncultured Dysgonomonas sp.]|uniref:Uncharacterized protein n=1 Tax=uncultured Dysgonomonas sp. TaxID=206096 RepID=A0A212IXA8_9BACT|nr:hypothetical protein [uncultured Dysgonomonas sp.]SBV91861.1 hypothetical protein KL86DYS1_10452 [uncultured Dysgonomonas sp.]